MIEALDQWSIEQIKSSVVITSLVAVVKELVENALDSGATIINVRLTNYGLDGVSVQDNGSGIAEEDFPLLAVKHATSKLASHAELNSVEQLGFRGEALASICNMSKLQITTSTGGKFGHVLDFDENGQIVSDKQIAARKGTIATVTSFFHNLPVRQKTMQREHKKGLSDVTALLQTYAIIAPVTLVFEHITKDKAKRAILRSQGAQMKNRIAAVFSTNLASQLVEIKHESNIVQISGYVSRLDASFTGGAGSGRQLIFINKRPSDQASCSKCIKEFYKQNQQTGQPFFALNFDVAPDTIDVNCSPDKRMIVLHNETIIARELMFALERALCINAIVVPRQEDTRTPIKQATLKLDRFKGAGTMITQTGSNSEKVPEEDSSQEDIDSTDMQPSKSPVIPAPPLSYTELRRDSVQTMQENVMSNKTSHSDTRTDPVEPVRIQVQSKNQGSTHSTRKPPEFQLYSRDAPPTRPNTKDRSEESNIDEESHTGPAVNIPSSDQERRQPSNLRELLDRPLASATRTETLETFDSGIPEKSTSLSEQSENFVSRPLKPIDQTISSYPPGFRPAGELLGDPDLDSGTPSSPPTYQRRASGGNNRHQREPSPEPMELEPASKLAEERAKSPLDKASDINTAGGRQQVEVAQGHSQLSGNVNSSGGSSGSSKKKRKASTLGHRVSLTLSLDEIANAREVSDQLELPDVRNLDIASEEAEKRLSLIIKKDDFAQMTVVGQFNRGFIIVTKKADSNVSDHKDIFVIDQHASDEIYNFETLQTTVTSKPQHLVQPLVLQLSPVEELTLIDNLEIFKNNGFFFEIDPTATPGRQCKLKTVPYYKTLTFGKDDVYELIHKIQEDPSNKQVKCSKLRSMFAMRACRMSIMIGTVLSESTMIRVVRHLGELKKPWNCPHGRPTLRHITTLR